MKKNRDYKTYYDSEEKSIFTLVDGHRRRGVFEERFIRQDFPSIYHLMEEVKLPRHASKDEHVSSRIRENDWAGTKTLGEAIVLARTGWNAKIPEIQSLVDSIKYKLSHLLKDHEPVRDNTGSFVDVDAYIQGEPENMIDWQVTSKAKPTLSIMFNSSTSSGTSPRTMHIKGSIIVALIDILETLGVRVYLQVCSAQMYSKHSSMNIIQVKDANEPLNLNLVSFALAHPAFLRQIMFKLWETYPAHYYSPSLAKEHYGYPANLDDLKHLTTLPQSDLYIASSNLTDGVFSDPNACASWVLETLKAQGLEVLG